MRLVLTLGFSIILVFSAYSQLHISSSQVWDDDTVFVDQNIIVDAGATLTIGAGTVVFFRDRNFIDVYGQLAINGEAGDSVTMTAPDTTWIVNSGKTFHGWGGIYAYGHGIVNATFTVFEKLGYSHHSKNGYTVVGLLYNESSQAMVFDHCRFAFKRDPQQTYDGSAITGDKATIVVKNSQFRNNIGRGVLMHMENSGTLIVTNTTFINNDLWGFMLNASGASFKIESCRFEGNKTRGLLYGTTFNGSSSVEKNTFINNLGAIHLQGVYSSIFFRNNIYRANGGQIYFWLGSNIITGNVFMDNYYADPYDFFGNDYEGILRIENTEIAGPVITNNTFINNRAMALRMWSTNTFSIANNIFHNNYPSDISLSLDSEWMNTGGRTFQHNLLPQLVPGTGNRKGDPRIGEGNDNFTLAANSPGINSGTSVFNDHLLPSDVLGNPRVSGQIDMGAVESVGSYVPLTAINISDTAIAHVGVGGEVASFSTTNAFTSDEITYTLADANGVNNDYFTILGNKLMLAKELTAETLLRIRVRAVHSSGAWLSEYYYLTAEPVVVGTENHALSGTRVFPVPADKFIYIDDQEQWSTYTIISLSGIEVKAGIPEGNRIDISGLSDGLYIIRLSAGNKINSVRFNKQTR